jgi:hypothetical protein
MGIVGIHPAVFRKSADRLDCKRVVKYSWCKERKERRKSAAGKGKPQVRLEIFDRGCPHTPPIRCMNIKRKGLQEGQFVSV